jgi:coenzyme F420-0:L-glutamate ligase/coenzyme F420-1:gamma-L-glutamate ligase
VAPRAAEAVADDHRDARARQLAHARAQRSRRRVAVIVTDSFGRAWRHGQVDVAIGLAGMRALDDWRGRADSAGMRLQATWLAVADAAAACADLARAKDSREPIVVVDGLERYVTEEDGPGAAALLRPRAEDLFG